MASGWVNDSVQYRSMEKNQNILIFLNRFEYLYVLTKNFLVTSQLSLFKNRYKIAYLKSIEFK